MNGEMCTGMSGKRQYRGRSGGGARAGERAREQFALMRWLRGWAEAPIKIARMTLTIKLDGNWSSFQLANNTPPLSVTGSVIAPSARMACLCVYAIYFKIPQSWR